MTPYTNDQDSPKGHSNDDKAQKEIEIAGAVQAILRAIGEDPGREGLRRTPQRFAKAIQFLTQGYDADLDSVINNAIFTVDNNDIVIVREIEVSSLCEHHLLPFTGKAHIAYLPQGRVLGLSKLAKLTQVFARRLQIQERLTSDVANAIQEVLKPAGVAVVMECEHMCMSMRGVQQKGTTTVTECRTGRFWSNADAYARFLALLNVARQ